MYDPDAPTGSGWWHWLIFNIPANVHELKRGAGDPKKNLAPKNSIQSVTDFGTPGYGGPCPPVGDKPHRYIITVYALDVEKLDLDQNTRRLFPESARSCQGLDNRLLRSINWNQVC